MMLKTFFARRQLARVLDHLRGGVHDLRRVHDRSPKRRSHSEAECRRIAARASLPPTARPSPRFPWIGALTSPTTRRQRAFRPPRRYRRCPPGPVSLQPRRPTGRRNALAGHMERTDSLVEGAGFEPSVPLHARQDASGIPASGGAISDGIGLSPQLGGASGVTGALRHGLRLTVTELCYWTVRCSWKRLRAPQPPARRLNWSGSVPTLTVPAKRAGAVRAGGCEPACSPRRYQPLRRSLFAYWVACWPWPSFWIRIAHRDACTTTSPALGAGRGGDPGGSRRHGQQCFLWRGSRAESMAGHRFFAARPAS
jgi:hypothetical protein